MRAWSRPTVPPLLALLAASLAATLASSAPALAGIAVTGRVLGPSGAAIPEAQVMLLSSTPATDLARLAMAGTSHPEPLAGAVSDARGGFRLEAPRAGLYTVRIEAAGHAPVQAWIGALVEEAELPDAELQADAGLTVTVSGAEGEPMAGALVVVRRDATVRSFARTFWNPAPRVALTGPDGTARLPRGAKELLIVGAARPGLAPATRTGRLPASVALALAATAALPVEIRGADGKPVADAVVLADEAGLPLAWSGADGRAALTLPADGLEVAVHAADDRSFSTRLAPPPAEPQPPQRVTLTLPAQATLSGRVIDAQTRKPIPGALVYAPAERRAVTVADDGGRYTLRLPGSGSNSVRAVAPGYRRGGEADSLEVTAKSSRGPTLALEPAARVEGTVADDKGRPLPGVSVTATENDPRFGGGRRMVRRAFGEAGPGDLARTDAQGRFRIGGLDPARGYTVAAELKGYAPAEAEVNGLLPRQTKGGVALVMKPGARATGRIVDTEERPIAGVEIRSTETPEGGGGRFFSFGFGGGDDSRPDATTDAEGAFALADLKPGRYDLTAKHRGFATKTVPGLEIAIAAAPVDLGAITLEPAARIEGTVTGPGGAPVEEVEVWALGGGPFPMIPGLRPPGDPNAVTGSDGWFAIEDRRAGEKVDLMFRRTGYVSERRPGIEAGAAAPLAVELRPASQVSGIVVSGDKPVAGARVMLSRSAAGGTGGDGFVMIAGGDWAESDDTGAFVFESVEPGKISLRTSADGFQEKTLDEIEVPEGEDLEGLRLLLEPGAVVEGTVLLADGRPAIGARVEPVDTTPVRGPRMMVNASTSDGDGRYRLEGLKSGPGSISARHDEYGRAVKDIELRPGLNRLDLTFPGGQPVSGRVVDAGGAPVAGALVEVQPASQRWGGNEATTGPDGAFTVDGVQDGSYQLAASRQGFAPAVDARKFEVKGAPVSGLVVTLRAGGALVGTVQGVSPEEFASVAVTVRSDAAWGSGNVDFKGNYRVADLAPGRYSVRAMTRDGGRSATGDVEIVAGTPETRLDLDFGKGLALSGRALLGEQPVAGASIWARGKTVQSFGQGRTDAEGAFSIEGLEPATYDVTLNLWEKGITYTETVDVSASREITLRLPTMKVEGRVVDALDRAAVAGVSVTLAPEGQGDEPGWFRGGYGALSAESGRFAIANVAPGTYRLSAKKEGYAAHTESVVVSSGQDVANLELSLDPTEGLSLQVRLPGGGVPAAVSAAVLDATGRSVTGGRYPTGEAGRVRLPTVPPGSWEVLVQSAGSAVATIQATAPGGPLPVQLAPATELKLRVKDLEGSKVIATVRVAGADGRLHRTIGWGAGARAEIEAVEGRTAIEGLPAGSWTVTVTAPDGRTWQGSATTAPGLPAELVL